MRITVMGPGGVGGYFGARLAAAGNDVTFVARGAHLAAMQARRPAPRQRHRQAASQPGQGRCQRRRHRCRRCHHLRGQDARHRERRGKPASAGGKGCRDLHLPERSGERRAHRQDRRCRQRGGRGGAHRLEHPRAGRGQANRQVRNARVRRARRQTQRPHERLSRGLRGSRHRCQAHRQHLPHPVAQVRHAGAGRRHDGADARSAGTHPRGRRNPMLCSRRRWRRRSRSGWP